MKREDINIRDPYVLNYQGKYYLYGTRSATCWSKADGFDVYVGEDFDNWTGPIEIFHRPEDFFADQNFWAPECIYYKGAFYLITTFGGEGFNKGTYILKSDSPTGPFELYSERLNPEDWVCIDATVYFEGDRPWIVYSKSFESSPEGLMYAQELSEDLKTMVGEPVKLFEASEASWAKPVPFAKAEFGMDGDVYFTDGPGIFTGDKGQLIMTWSSWSKAGYAVGLAISENGQITGPWQQLDEPLWPENGGHGMSFIAKDGKRYFTLHYPNDKYAERPVFYPITVDGDNITLEK